jgi:hypothetical protein
LKFGFTTNDYLQTRQNVARVLQSNLCSINVSIESLNPQVNESLRPRKHGTQQTLEGIDNLERKLPVSGVALSTVILIANAPASGRSRFLHKSEPSCGWGESAWWPAWLQEDPEGFGISRGRKFP